MFSFLAGLAVGVVGYLLWDKFNITDKIVGFLKHIPLIGKFFAAILAAALMLWAASSARKPVAPSAHSASCCGMPTPKPMPSVAPER